MDREALAHFLRVRPEEVAARGESGDHASPLMTFVLERLSQYPAVVFSRFGESSRFLAERWLTDPPSREHYLIDAGVTGDGRLRRYRHAELGGLELYRQLLVDPVQYQMLLVFMAVPGSASEEKLRRLAGVGD